tara:strand:+ start:10278 stop:10667 length:390 start_codon:yes stop_codon:yes gene_type:complete
MKTKGSVVILEKEGEFLLQLRDDTNKIQHPNEWGLFGGRIEEGETPINAAIREIKEELNLNLEEDLLEKVYEFINEKREITIFRYFLKNDLAELKLGEGQDMKLFSKEEISKMNNIIPGVKRLIENLNE